MLRKHLQSQLATDDVSKLLGNQNSPQSLDGGSAASDPSLTSQNSGLGLGGSGGFNSGNFMSGNTIITNNGNGGNVIGGENITNRNIEEADPKPQFEPPPES